MPKAKLSQVATTWVDEKNVSRGRKRKEPKEPPKKKQTFSLKIETIKQLWMHRALTGRTISGTIDDLVFKHIPRG